MKCGRWKMKEHEYLEYYRIKINTANNNLVKNSESKKNHGVEEYRNGVQCPWVNNFYKSVNSIKFSAVIELVHN